MRDTDFCLTLLFSLRSDRKLTVRGAEGVEIEGKKVSLKLMKVTNT